MAGLLDIPQQAGGLLSQASDFATSPLGQGLLSAAFAGLATAGRPGYGRWSSLGAAGLAGLQGYTGAQENQRQAAFDEQRKKLMTAQLTGLATQNESQQFDLTQRRKRQSFWDNMAGQQSGGQSPMPGGPEAGDTPIPQPGGATGTGSLPTGAQRAPGQQVNPLEMLRNGYSVEEARSLSDLPNWGAPEVVRYVEVPNAQGKLEMVGLDKYGRRVNTGVNPWTAPVWQDRGGTFSAVDPVSLRDLRSVRKTMSPGEAAADQRARENMQWQRENGNSQIIQTDQGPVVVNTRNAQATPVTGPGGQTYTRPLNTIPASANTAIITNQQNLAKINDALNLLEGKDVGKLKGDKDATGWKGYLPQAALNRADPGGIDARAMIADLGSLIIHDRSGAAVTAAESPRLMPFIPLITDSKETAVKKLQRFKQLYEAEQQGLQDIYSRANGYKQPSFAANPRSGDRPPLDSFNSGQPKSIGQRPPLSSFEGN
jgi:hypothetical protein